MDRHERIAKKINELVYPRDMMPGCRIVMYHAPGIGPRVVLETFSGTIIKMQGGDTPMEALANLVGEYKELGYMEPGIPSTESRGNDVGYMGEV